MSADRVSEVAVPVSAGEVVPIRSDGVEPIRSDGVEPIRSDGVEPLRSDAGASRSHADMARTLLAAAVFAAALAVGAGVSAVALLVAVAVVQALLVLAWTLTAGPPLLREGAAVALGPSSSAMPGRIGSVVIGAAAAAGADIAVSVRPHSALAPLLVVLGLALPAMFVHQLTRGVVRVRVVESLSGIAVLVVAVTALAALLQLRHESDGARMTVAAVVVAGTTVVLGYAVDLVWPRPRFDPAVPRGLTAVVLSAGAGTASGVVVLRPLSQYGTGIAVVLCAAIAVASALVAVSSSMIAYGIDAAAPEARTALRSSRPVAIAAMPLAMVAPVSYLLLLVR